MFSSSGNDRNVISLCQCSLLRENAVVDRFEWTINITTRLDMISEQTIFPHFAVAQLCQSVIKMQRCRADLHFGIKFTNRV
jgi:hypothetical protein